MRRSSHFAPSGSFPARDDRVEHEQRASGGAAAWMTRRIASARSSSQSWRIRDRTYASPAGNSLEEAALDERRCDRRDSPRHVRSRAGRRRSPVAPAGGRATRAAAPRCRRRRPRPSRRRATSSAGQQFRVRSFPPAIAASNAARSSAFASSHDQKSVAEFARERLLALTSDRASRSRVARRRRRSARTRASCSPVAAEEL